LEKDVSLLLIFYARPRADTYLGGAETERKPFVM